MTWQRKIAIGMALIKEGCEQNNMWCNCNDCPMAEVCDQLFDGAIKQGNPWDGALLPDKWELVD